MNPWVWGDLFVAVPLAALADSTAVGPQASIASDVVLGASVVFGLI